MDRITLDKDVFKALASDTRLDILKALDERQKTVTELARELELNKATVFEHLEKLAEVELVQKLEDDRKWVYYQLSWKGRRLLHPEAITIALLLSTAAASAVTALAALWAWTAGKAFDPFPTSGEAGDAAAAGESMPAAPPPESQPMAADEGARSIALAAPEQLTQDPVLLGIAIALGLLVLLLGALALLVWRRARTARAQAPPPSA